MSPQKPTKDALLKDVRVDRSSVSLKSINDESNDKEYWLSQTPEERLQHMEVLRRINYGDASTARLQRILEVVEREGR